MYSGILETPVFRVQLPTEIGSQSPQKKKIQVLSDIIEIVFICNVGIEVSSLADSDKNLNLRFSECAIQSKSHLFCVIPNASYKERSCD